MQNDQCFSQHEMCISDAGMVKLYIYSPEANHNALLSPQFPPEWFW